jgi:drug/metabolite transporter (DMT)-like permease
MDDKPTTNAKTPKNLNQNINFHLHTAALLLGGTALFSKLIPFDAWDIIAFRALICGLVLLLIALVLKHKIIISNIRLLSILIVCSLLFTVHWTAYFQAMKLSTVAVGIISMFTFPVMTVFLEPLIKKTELHLQDIVMGVLVLVGVSLIVPSFTLQDEITVGVLFGLLSALAVALRNILVSQYLSSLSPFTIMIFHSFVSAAVLLPFASISHDEISTHNWLYLFLLGTIFTAIPHTQKTFALMSESAKSVSMIISLQVVYATIFAYFLLSEGLNINTFIGGSMILFAAIYESVFAKR